MKTNQIIGGAAILTATYLFFKKMQQTPTKPKSNVFGGANLCSARNLRSFNAGVSGIIQATIKAFGNLSMEQQNNVQHIINAFDKYGDCDNAKLAYILATAWHESRFSPTRECFAKTDAAARACVKNRSYGKVINGRVYYGRGFSQLTWDYNYRTFGQLLKIDLLNNPDLAMNPIYAAEILVVGMMDGKFTTKKLGSYITDVAWDFFNARRTVNALDRAGKIKGYAESLIA